MHPHFASSSVRELIATYGYLGVGLGIGIESIGIPFPGETILVAAAIYAGAGHLSIVGVMLAAALGAIIGDNIGFLVGRYGGFQLLHRFGKYLKIYPRHLKHAEHFFQKHGGKTVFWGRFVSLLRMWAAFLAGANRMDWRRFLLYNAAGGIIWAVFYSLLGYLLGRHLRLLSLILHAIGYFGFIILFVVIAIVGLAWRRILGQLDE